MLNDLYTFYKLRKYIQKSFQYRIVRNYKRCSITKFIKGTPPVKLKSKLLIELSSNFPQKKRKCRHFESEK